MVEFKNLKIDPDVMGGTVCMAGTRMPVKQMLVYIAEQGLEEFAKDFNYDPDKIWDIIGELGNNVQRWVEEDAKKQHLYFVTVIGTRNWDGKEEYDRSRCWGYYYNLDDAITAIVENHTDIHECWYDYAVIESVPWGVLPIGTEELKWFKWNAEADRYELISKPEFSNQIVNWAIG